MSKPTALVQGTLDLLILKILALQPAHGWAGRRVLTEKAAGWERFSAAITAVVRAV